LQRYGNRPVDLEVGGRLGHLVKLLPLACELASRGHKVVPVLRDLSRVGDVFAGIDLSCLQAPIKTRQGGHRVDFPEPSPISSTTAALPIAANSR
jgi:hypothetical protein